MTEAVRASWFDGRSSRPQAVLASLHPGPARSFAAFASARAARARSVEPGKPAGRLARGLERRPGTTGRDGGPARARQPGDRGCAAVAGGLRGRRRAAVARAAHARSAGPSSSSSRCWRPGRWGPFTAGAPRGRRRNSRARCRSIGKPVSRRGRCRTWTSTGSSRASCRPRARASCAPVSTRWRSRSTRACTATAPTSRG